LRGNEYGICNYRNRRSLDAARSWYLDQLFLSLDQKGNDPSGASRIDPYDGIYTKTYRDEVKTLKALHIGDD
jgi:hypothetical protein